MQCTGPRGAQAVIAQPWACPRILRGEWLLDIGCMGIKTR